MVVALKDDATVLTAAVDAAFFAIDVEIDGCGLLIEICPFDIFR